MRMNGETSVRADVFSMLIFIVSHYTIYHSYDQGSKRIWLKGIDKTKHLRYDVLITK